MSIIPGTITERSLLPSMQRVSSVATQLKLEQTQSVYSDVQLITMMSKNDKVQDVIVEEEFTQQDFYIDVKNILRKRHSRQNVLQKNEVKAQSSFKFDRRRKKKKNTKKWPLDTENGKLSYSRMVYKRNKKHYRIPNESLNQNSSVIEVIDHKMYPIYSTNMGEITCC